MADVGKSRILLLTDRFVARWMPGTGLWKQAWGKGRRFRATPRKPQVMRLSDSTVGAAPGFESAISSLGKKLSTESDHFHDVVPTVAPRHSLADERLHCNGGLPFYGEKYDLPP